MSEEIDIYNTDIATLYGVVESLEKKEQTEAVVNALDIVKEQIRVLSINENDPEWKPFIN